MNPTNKRETMEHQYLAYPVHCYDIGAGIFLKWEMLNESILPSWSYSYFGLHASVVAVCDESMVAIEISDLTDEDRKSFYALYEKYDINNDYEVYYDFEEAVTGCTVLPYCVTEGILSELLHDHLKKNGINYRAHSIYTATSGIIFSERMPSESNKINFAVPARPLDPRNIENSL